MNQVLLVKELENNIKKKTKGQGVNHERGNVRDILPFTSSKKTKLMKDNYMPLMGAFVRNINNVKLMEPAKEQDELSFEGNSVTQNIVDLVRCENEDVAFDLARFLNQYLFNNEQIKPIHPYLYNYIPFEAKSDEQKYANFLFDVFASNHPQISNIFNKSESADILTSLILDNIKGIQESSKKRPSEYQMLSNNISQLFISDLTYLAKHKDYFLEHFPLLVHYYFFMYTCQVTIKLDRFENGDLEEIEPLFFALEWESINKRRNAASDIEGFKRVKNISQNLFVHIHTLSQLSHISLNNSEGNIKDFLTYNEILEAVKIQGPEAEKSFIEDLNNWLNVYTENAKVNLDKIPSSIEEGFHILFNCLKQGMSSEVCKKYGTNIEDVGGAQFLKQRGSLGKILNLSHDMFLVIAAVSVKDQRIPLKQFFIEFERRGISLDRYSKEVVINLLDSLNIIDKKSDSGDAQYVKPIL